MNTKKQEIVGYHNFASAQPELFDFHKKVFDGEKSVYFKYIQFIIDIFNPTTILDFAAGTCWTSYILSKKYTVVAMEMNNSSVCGIGIHRHNIKAILSSKSINSCLSYNSKNINIVQGDCEHSPFKRHFDLVFCSQALHHATDLDKMVLEMSSTLKINGVMIASGEHIRPLFSSNENFKRKHPAVKYGANENAYHWYRYFDAFQKAGMNVTIIPRGYECDFETIKQRPIRKMFQTMRNLKLSWLIDFILLNFSGSGTEVTIIGKNYFSK